jgi:hypothetical protein
LLLPFLALGVYMVREGGWSAMLISVAITGGVLLCLVLGLWLLQRAG